MTDNLTFSAAVVAGLLSFLSPCVLPLTPLYLTYMTGVAAGDLNGAPLKKARLRILAAALAYIAGFTTVFVSLGALAGVIGPYIKSYAFQVASGALIIAMGLHFLGVFQIGALTREKRMQTAPTVGLVGSFVMGLAFASGWTPCIGPLLSPFLLKAGNEATIGYGAALLAAYSFGLGLPFLFAALAMDLFLGFVKRFRPYLGAIEKVAGVLLIVMGVAFILGGVESAGGWINKLIPGFDPAD